MKVSDYCLHRFPPDSHHKSREGCRTSEEGINDRDISLGVQSPQPKFDLRRNREPRIQRSLCVDHAKPCFQERVEGSLGPKGPDPRQHTGLMPFPSDGATEYLEAG